MAKRITKRAATAKKTAAKKAAKTRAKKRDDEMMQAIKQSIIYERNAEKIVKSGLPNAKKVLKEDDYNEAIKIWAEILEKVTEHHKENIAKGIESDEEKERQFEELTANASGINETEWFKHLPEGKEFTNA